MLYDVEHIKSSSMSSILRYENVFIEVTLFLKKILQDIIELNANTNSE